MAEAQGGEKEVMDCALLRDFFDGCLANHFCLGQGDVEEEDNDQHGHERG
jgi:hypothetical protein